jgi:hypothetical protein
MNQFPPQAHEYPMSADSNCFGKLAEIFAAQGAPPVSLTLVVNGKNLQSEKFQLFCFAPSLYYFMMR